MSSTRRAPQRWTSRLPLTSLVREAVSAISRRPARSIFTALGTVVGVGAFIATTGLAATARAQVSDSFDVLQATEVRAIDSPGHHDNPFPPDTDERLEQLNGVNNGGLLWSIDDTNLDARSLIAHSRQPSAIPIVAATPGAIAALHPTITEGVTIDRFHAERAERVALLGAVAATQLGINRIDTQPAVFIGDTSYTVIGIIDNVTREPSVLSSIILPAGTAARELPNGNADYTVVVDVDQGAANVVGSQLAVTLRPQDPDRLSILVPPDPRTLRASIESDVTSLLYGLAGLALFVGMVGIANTTLVAVMERRTEIGVRRALGARRRHIAGQFVVESAFLGALGGALGTSAGIVTVVAIATTRDWTTTIDPRYVLAAPLIGAITGLLAGLPPAWRASRVTPATALRSQ